MPEHTYDVVIVGGGLAGLHAGRVLVKEGLQVALVDENPVLGGQYMRRRHPDLFDGDFFDFAKRTGAKTIRELMQQNLKRVIGAEVIGLEPDRRMLIRNPKGGLIETQPLSVILATGARERFVPFKGWTLPGIMSTGAMQILMKTTGFVPDGRIVVSGSGVFPYAVFSQMCKHGKKPTALIDENTFSQKLRFTKALIFAPEKLPEAVKTAWNVGVYGAIPCFGRRIIEARGDGKIESVVSVKLNGSGTPVPSTEKTYNCDWLALGQGFIPNTELARSAECKVTHDSLKGRPVVDISDDFQTSQEGIFAAGEITGIAGAGKSIIEGTLAAYGVLRFLGKTVDGGARQRINSLNSARRRHLAFGAFFNALCRQDDSVFTGISDETIVCRCEDITMGEVRGCLIDGCRTLNEIKRAVRTGMGMCQGRTCEPFLVDYVSASLKKSPADLKLLKLRCPVKAITIEDLAGSIDTL